MSAPTPMEMRSGGMYFNGHRVVRIDPLPWTDSQHERLDAEERIAAEDAEASRAMLGYALFAVAFVAGVVASHFWPGVWW